MAKSMSDAQIGEIIGRVLTNDGYATMLRRFAGRYVGKKYLIGERVEAISDTGRITRGPAISDAPLFESEDRFVELLKSAHASKPYTRLEKREVGESVLRTYRIVGGNDIYGKILNNLDVQVLLKDEDVVICGTNDDVRDQMRLIRGAVARPVERVVAEADTEADDLQDDECDICGGDAIDCGCCRECEKPADDCTCDDDDNPEAEHDAHEDCHHEHHEPEPIPAIVTQDKQPAHTFVYKPKQPPQDSFEI